MAYFEGKNAEEIYSKLEDNLIEVYGDKYRSKFILPGSGRFTISRLAAAQAEIKARG